MRNARPTTLRARRDYSFSLHTDNRQLPTDNCSAMAAYTSGHPLEIGPKSLIQSHFLGPAVVISTCQDWIGKLFCAKQIGADG
jgi:hypothetical protein